MLVALYVVSPLTTLTRARVSAVGLRSAEFLIAKPVGILISVLLFHAVAEIVAGNAISTSDGSSVPLIHAEPV